MALEVKGLRAGYGGLRVLHDVDLRVAAGEVVGLLGPNGAGKTTLLRALSGLLKDTQGEILLSGMPLHGVPVHTRVHHGIVHVPEGRGLFRGLTVEENLLVGDVPPGSQRFRLELDEIYEMFPDLKGRRRQRVATLSGGQQQMLAIGRALRLNLAVLLLDEPTTGLAPLLVEALMNVVGVIASRGVAVLLVEQRVAVALGTVHRLVVLAGGRIVLQANRDEVTLEDIRRAYLRV